MGTAIPTNSVWAAMSYTPPRGRCNFKASLMSPACPCLRFMLHPVKAATSFDCDGCQHHASFHSLENKDEDAILKKWEEQQQQQQQEVALVQRQPITDARRKQMKMTDRSRQEIGYRSTLEVIDVTDEIDEAVEEQLHQELVGTKRRRAASEDVERPEATATSDVKLKMPGVFETSPKKISDAPKEQTQQRSVKPARAKRPAKESGRLSK